MVDGQTAETQETASHAATETSATSTTSTAQPESASAPAQGTFLDGTGLQADQLPEQVRPVYEQMQKAYTQKTQSVAEEKRYADAFRTLVADQRFIDWYNGIKTGNQQTQQTQQVPTQQENPFSIPTEEWETLKENPEKFAKWQAQAFEKFVEQKYAPQINQDRQQMADLKSEHELNLFAQTHPDFWDIDKLSMEKDDDLGLMEIMTASGLDLNTSYSLGKRIMENVSKMATQKAHQMVTQKIASSSEARGSQVQPSGSTVSMKGGITELIRRAAEEAVEGRNTVVRRER